MSGLGAWAIAPAVAAPSSGTLEVNMSATRSLFRVTAAAVLLPVALTACERRADRTADDAMESTGAAWKGIPVDEGQAITVDASTRQAVLAEMRTMLQAVQGIVGGAATWDTAAIRTAASSAGVAAASEANPGVEAQLGEDFVRLGMRTHLSFDSLAHDVGKNREAVLTRLATVMGNCVGCHNQWRLVVQP
jgi:cytochrome c556